MPLLDPYERPPDQIRTLYKHYQKLSVTDLGRDEHIVDFRRKDQSNAVEGFHVISTIDTSMLHFISKPDNLDAESPRIAHVYESAMLPGLHIVPSLVSEDLQLEILSRLFHRDLANAKHQTNLHKHYHIPYERTNKANEDDHSGISNDRSFFNMDPDSKETFEPIDPDVHRPLTISQVLNKKLRWITLGGQYDWTMKRYPDEQAPEFPRDIAAIVQRAFPDMTPEAAIVNVYSPGDTLSLHRDVSEEADEGLVSLSIGCDGVFVVGLDNAADSGSRSIAIRLSSGDAVYMTGASRYAWHGVPNIIASTCPPSLEKWPALEPDKSALQNTNASNFDAWRGWMKNKRINLNVRQMNP